MEGVITKPLLTVVSFIIVLAGYGQMVSAVNDWTLLTYDAGKINSSRIDRVVGFTVTPLEDANEAWYDNALSAENTASGSIQDNTYYKVEQETGGTGCQIKNIDNEDPVYAQNGTRIAVGDTGVLAGCKWSEAEGIWDAGGYKDLIRLAFQAGALGLPVGILYVAMMFGKSFMMGSLGISPVLAVIIMIVSFLLVSRLLDTITPFVSDARDTTSGDRFRIYNEGLGQLGAIVGNFYMLVMAAGVIYFAWKAIGVIKGISSSGGASVAQGM